MNIELIKKDFDRAYGFNIYRTDRKRHKVYARKTFSLFTRKLELFTFEEIGKQINVSHDNVIHYYNTSYSIKKKDKAIFNTMCDKYKVAFDKFEMPKEKEVVKIELKNTPLEELLQFDEDTIKDFVETRLKPYLRMRKLKVAN